MRGLPEGMDMDVDVDDVAVWSADVVVVCSPIAATVARIVGVSCVSEELGLKGVNVWMLEQFPMLWGRQLRHVLPAFTHEQFLQEPEQLHLQQGMSVHVLVTELSVPVWNLWCALII